MALPEAAPGVAELREDPEQALLGAAALGELVWVTAGERRLLLVSGAEGAREVLVERSGELAKPPSQALPLDGRAIELADVAISPAEIRRQLSKGMGADRADETAAGLVAALDWSDGDSFPLMPWLRPRVARAVVRGAFASDLSDEELARLAEIVRKTGLAPRVTGGGPSLRRVVRPFRDAQLSLVVRSLLAHADLSRPSELTAVMDLPPRQRTALAGELLLGAIGPLVQECGWTLYRLGTGPAPADGEAFVREVTRLHPTNPLIVRVATTETSVGGERVPASSLVVLHVAALHRDPSVYPEPERFLPERWLDGRTAGHRFSYAAFGIGERRCLGEAIALRSLVALVETVGPAWELTFSDVDVAARGRRQLSDDVRITVRRRG